MTNSDYAVIISARMSSERLPGKALVSYCPDGTPNLKQIIRRWQTSRRDPCIVVATTDGQEDDVIESLCNEMKVNVYRGSRDNVLARMNGAIEKFSPSAKYVARALADNPLVDVGLADWRLDVLHESGADGVWYGGEESRITYAGTTDVWSRAGWDRICEASSGSQLEHAGAWFWDNLSKVAVVPLPLPRREYLAQVRTELDTEEDLEMFRRLFEAVDYFGVGGSVDTLHAMVTLFARPDIWRINDNVELKTQTVAHWSKGSHWCCKSCAARVGGVVAGDLELRCFRCGRPQKFYAMKPKRK